MEGRCHVGREAAGALVGSIPGRGAADPARHKVVVVRSMGKAGGGAWEGWCGRWYKGYPERGQRITHILVWDKGNNNTVASYRVKAECPNQLDPNPTA